MKRLLALAAALSLSPPVRAEIKPPALVVLPTEDPTGAFDDPASRTFRERLMEGYDVYVVRVDTKQQMYKAVTYITTLRGPESIELLVIARHGERERLQFSAGDEESHYLDISDKEELANVLKKLSPRARIFLDSCSTGGKHNQVTNMALGAGLWECYRDIPLLYRLPARGKTLLEIVAEASDGREVTGSIIPYLSKWIEIKTVYPLELRIYNPRCGEDYTIKK